VRASVRGNTPHRRRQCREHSGVRPPTHPLQSERGPVLRVSMHTKTTKAESKCAISRHGSSENATAALDLAELQRSIRTRQRLTSQHDLVKVYHSVHSQPRRRSVGRFAHPLRRHASDDTHTPHTPPHTAHRQLATVSEGNVSAAIHSKSSFLDEHAAATAAATAGRRKNADAGLLKPTATRSASVPPRSRSPTRSMNPLYKWAQQQQQQQLQGAQCGSVTPEEMAVGWQQRAELTAEVARLFAGVHSEVIETLLDSWYSEKEDCFDVATVFGWLLDHGRKCLFVLFFTWGVCMCRTNNVCVLCVHVVCVVCVFSVCLCC
jgi:hypothetical protein